MQKQWYDRNTCYWEFSTKDQVLILLPTVALLSGGVYTPLQKGERCELRGTNYQQGVREIIYFTSICSANGIHQVLPRSSQRTFPAESHMM